ncbi:MATE family efflux transporter [Lichenifustis flavocetrariae]|uniref:MATE family efflux transporter n=1 Tax=Lichenifustis flavocetrariae TaxID=2949735 RepID=A0AA41YXX3_9HYPH|nr:MATE family efflux transporter [Lichenifustis flavocetrariae]MCW6509058.1 MATE family efflux transporter [Lichenifustis flavocetrariae]
MTLSQVTTPLLGFVGATVIGRLGDPALLGAVALGAVVFDVLFWTFGSLRMATAGLTAQAVGRGDMLEIDLVLARALLVGSVAGVLLLALQKPIGAAAFTLTGASPAVTNALTTYFRIRMFAAPFTFANYALLGSTLGRGRTDLGLVLQISINALNLILTLVFVLGAGWGIAGAALAPVAAEIGGVALGVTVMRHVGSHPFSVRWAALTQRDALLRMLAVNRDVMIRTIALMLAFAVFASMGARAGDATLAANAVLQNMFAIGGYFLDGFATAAETLCGQAFGARNEVDFRAAVRLSLLWCLGFGAATALVFLATGRIFVGTITTSQVVRDTAMAYLPYAALTPLVGAAAFAFDGIYIGATWTAAMRNLMLVALSLYLGMLFCLGSTGNAGLWMAFLVFLATRGSGQAILYPGLVSRTFGPCRDVQKIDRDRIAV